MTRNINWTNCRKCGKEGITNDCGCPEPPANKPEPPKRRDSDKKDGGKK